jgi:hypothetical protein
LIQLWYFHDDEDEHGRDEQVDKHHGEGELTVGGGGWRRMEEEG